jgi:hypothetical protein
MNTTTSARSLVVISVITYSRTRPRRTLQYDTRTSEGEGGAVSVTGAGCGFTRSILVSSHQLRYIILEQTPRD